LLFTSYKIIYKAEALDEIAEAAQWYVNISTQVFTNFKLSLAQSEEEIIGNPYAFASLKYKKFRRKLLKDFPYKLIYFIDPINHEIIVFAFFHTARSNKFIKRRLKSN
jgi:hypothetical protein